MNALIYHDIIYYCFNFEKLHSNDIGKQCVVINEFEYMIQIFVYKV